MPKTGDKRCILQAADSVAYSFYVKDVESLLDALGAHHLSGVGDDMQTLSSCFREGLTEKLWRIFCLASSQAQSDKDAEIVVFQCKPKNVILRVRLLSGNVRDDPNSYFMRSRRFAHPSCKRVKERIHSESAQVQRRTYKNLRVADVLRRLLGRESV